MPPAKASDKSQLKRGRVSFRETPGQRNPLIDASQDSRPEGEAEHKKPRRSQRISSHVNTESQLPSPVTHHADSASMARKEGTITPPHNRPTESRTPVSSPRPFHGLTSPPSDTQTQTQTQSQFHPPNKALSYEVLDEEAEGVWGYLLPLDHKSADTMVLRRRSACPLPKGTMKKIDGKERPPTKQTYESMEENYEQTKIDGISSNGYLIGRHPECDRIIDVATVSNRHCLIFSENKHGQQVAVLEDLSGNGTFVNEGYVGRNKRRELQDGDEIAILDEARFVFRYPRVTTGHGFKQQFSISEQLGKGHFATVYLAIEKCTGGKFAIKKFEKRTGPGEKSRIEGLQQEIAVLMGVSHPNVLCLKDTFNETDGVYLVLELASEGELFNWIVMKSKLSEPDTRKVFIQLFQGLKYLHDRGIVHRDIKPENILLVDKELSVKLADFGLAKIIGEESFTTTLCGTPSYVAPEILESSNHRRYTRAVDVWSLGVVLYICLCGFPPFSDELYSKENPYNLSQQIKMGRFDYPSPYWDPVSDLALDLIDRMLTVDVEKRISVDECLEHPWTTQQQQAGPSDSIDGLTPAMGSLDFSKRKPKRERTMLSSINDVKVSHVVPLAENDPPLKVYQKNTSRKAAEKAKAIANKNGQKAATAGAPAPEAQQFTQYGVAKDEPMFGDDGGSRYANETTSVKELL